MAIKYAKLNSVKFGLAFGILTALSMLIFALWVLVSGNNGEFVNFIGDFYEGYDTSPLGMILGIIYGFVDGFLGGLVFAWIYNKLL